MLALRAPCLLRLRSSRSSRSAADGERLSRRSLLRLRDRPLPRSRSRSRLCHTGGAQKQNGCQWWAAAGPRLQMLPERTICCTQVSALPSGCSLHLASAAARWRCCTVLHSQPAGSCKQRTCPCPCPCLCAAPCLDLDPAPGAAHSWPTQRKGNTCNPGQAAAATSCTCAPAHTRPDPLSTALPACYTAHPVVSAGAVPVLSVTVPRLVLAVAPVPVVPHAATRLCWGGAGARWAGMVCKARLVRAGWRSGGLPLPLGRGLAARDGGDGPARGAQSGAGGSANCDLTWGSLCALLRA